MIKKQDIEPRNAEGQIHGLAIYYLDNGGYVKYTFVNGELHGLTEEYDHNGVLKRKYYWLNREQIFLRRKFYRLTKQYMEPNYLYYG